MTVMLDRDIDGVGQDNLVGTSSVLFVAVAITDPGVLARPVPDGTDDHFLRMGWFSLGDNFSVGVGDAFDWWRAPVWLDFERQLWTPDPSGVPGGAGVIQATRFRWALAPGVSAHAFVFGT